MTKDESAMNRNPSFSNRPRRICLFGTSANPPTGMGGHAGVIDALVKLRKFDEVRVLPVYRHTFASKRDQLLGFEQRVKMCELAVEDLMAGNEEPTTEGSNKPTISTKMVISRAEEDSFQRMLEVSQAETDEEKAALRVGTADLLEMLIEQEERGDKGDDAPLRSKTEFSFCLGADTFMDLTDWKWKRSKDVLRLLEGRLVVINRKQDGGKEKPTNDSLLQKRIDRINVTPLANGQIVLLNIPSLDDVSSSKIRNAEDKTLVNRMLSPKVLDYVIANQLYGFGKAEDKETA